MPIFQPPRPVLGYRRVADASADFLFSQPPTANRQYPFFRSQVSAIRYQVQVFWCRYRFRPAPEPVPDNQYLDPGCRDLRPGNVSLSLTFAPLHAASPQLHLCTASLRSSGPPALVSSQLLPCQQAHWSTGQLACTASGRAQRSAAINSHPFRYCFVSNASASGLFGNFMFTASHSSFTPEKREATLPSCTASVSGPA